MLGVVSSFPVLPWVGTGTPAPECQNVVDGLNKVGVD